MVKDMTEGSPFRLILGFALPLLAGNLFQQTYNLADAAIVGRYLGAESLAAVGAFTTIYQQKRSGGYRCFCQVFALSWLFLLGDSNIKCYTDDDTGTWLFCPLYCCRIYRNGGKDYSQPCICPGIWFYGHMLC